VDKAQYRDGGVIGEFDKYNSDAFNPETALYYELDESTTLYGSIAKKSNMPSLSDRYSTKFSTYTPNPELKAERAINYEVGIEKNFADTHLVKGSIFLSKAKDYIASVNLSGRMKQSQNIGEEEHKGFEVSLDSFWSDNVTTNFSYTYIKAKVEDNPDTPYVTDIPKHSFIGKIKYTPIAALDVIPEFRYESSRYINSELIYEEYKTKAFFLMDLKVAYRVKKDLEVAAGVKNLFDKNYYYSYGYPEEGRNYYANFRYIF
jgi:iron complex outermembrane receptor protein